jgi:hypothetical protein
VRFDPDLDIMLKLEQCCEIDHEDDENNDEDVFGKEGAKLYFQKKTPFY